MSQYTVFDGHNDVLARLFMDQDRDGVAAFRDGRPDGHVDGPKASAGGFGGGFFAVWIPPQGKKTSDPKGEMKKAKYDLPGSPAMDKSHAFNVAMDQIGILYALEEAGQLTICTTAKTIERCLAAGKMAAIFHMEGAEAIDADLEALDYFFSIGLRSLGPVWARPTAFAHGVPFRFPSSPDIGPGLTEAGFRLVARCNELGVLIDLSHLNEKGFWDVAKTSDAPLVATHSNAHALCPHARNLTDKQLDAIAESGGMVGLNFAGAFLRADGRMRSDTPLADMLAHLDHMIERMGEDCVALGSDFDGALVPQAIGDVSGLPALTKAMEAHGYGSDLIEKICHGNWLRVLDATWKAQPVSESPANVGAERLTPHH